MRNSVIPYREMCRREGFSLHRRINHGIGGDHSVILVLFPSREPCEGQPGDEGRVVVHEGDDERRTSAVPDPRAMDQPEFLPDGRLTQNGLFHRAAQEFAAGRRPPERVRIYEKLERGVWAYQGVHHLIDSWREMVGRRTVFKFKLLTVVGDEDFDAPPCRIPERRRVIPAWVKILVWRRDGRKCAACGAREALHFGDLAPCSGPETLPDPEEVRVLCVHHRPVMSEVGALSMSSRG